MAPKHYYSTLGVPKQATGDEILSAYRSLARHYHPDVNQSEDAAERFREINEAYAVLRDESMRRDYDNTILDSYMELKLGEGKRASTEFDVFPAFKPKRRGPSIKFLSMVAAIGLVGIVLFLVLTVNR